MSNRTSELLVSVLGAPVMLAFGLFVVASIWLTAYGELDCDQSRCYASTMGKTDAERKAAERARRRDQGLKPFELWLRPSEWPLVQRYVKRLRSKP